MSLSHSSSSPYSLALPSASKDITMQSHIKLHTHLITTCNSPSEAQRWLDSHTRIDGTILIEYKAMFMSVQPDELTIVDDHEVEHTHVHNNLSSHPRCPDCGCTTYVIILSAHDGWFGTYGCSCGHRFGYTHKGAKLKYCPYCAGSDQEPNGDTCTYCKGMWS